MCRDTIPLVIFICVGNGEVNGVVVNFGYESRWVFVVINGDSVVSVYIKTEVIFCMLE